MSAPGRIVAAQISALVISLVGVVWDCAALLWVLFPGGSGEWTALAAPAAFVIGVPCGIIALLIVWFLGRPSSGLRTSALAAAVLAMALPVVVSVLLKRW